MPLIGECRVVEAIQDNNISFIQKRYYFLPDQLRAGSRKEQEFGNRIHGTLLMQKNCSDLLGETCSTRFTKDRETYPLLFQVLSEKCNLCRFPTPVDTFKSDQPPGFGHCVLKKLKSSISATGSLGIIKFIAI